MKASKLLALSLSMIMFNLTSVGYANTATTMTTTGTTADTAMTQPTDQAIVSSIQSKIASDKTVSDLGVKVTSQSGIVSVVGNVNTDAEASKIIELVSETNGVKDTDTSQFKIKESKHPIADTVITAEVKGSFIREKLFGEKDVTPMSVSVETKDNVVYLTGTTNTQEQADNAVKLAKAVNGVKRVVSKIEVQAG